MSKASRALLRAHHGVGLLAELIHAGQQAVFLCQLAEGGVVTLEQILAAVDFFERDAIEASGREC